MSKFADLNLPPSLLKPLTQMGFHQPTPIQAAAIPVILKGRDVTALAQTGTGKTAAFGVPLLIRLMEQPHQKALILAPTRELAMQIHAFIKKLSGKNINLTSALIIGGASMNMQAIELRRGPRILVATPGRLNDHLGRNPKLLTRSSFLVLDEADRMLDMGFLPQIERILKAMPKVRQTMMFSATFPKEVRKLSHQFMHKPEEVSVGAPSQPVERIEQTVLETTQREKNELLLDELNARKGSVLIFTRTKHRTERLTRYLESYGYRVSMIHGDRSQGQRKAAIEGFRKGEFRILVATDIAARGLDINDIGHVINYDLPQVAEDYVHRIGRTARNGKGGQAVALLTPEDRVLWKSIAKLTQSVVARPRS
ncbi:MAG TPA: DEAD/DEAH box helicase [Bdellovibrionales bacterium]|nr:DEAD/DEAH box helicase [Bdellovibrionales bacterium]